jgi:hypothetical protein
MQRVTLVRYTTKPETADENEKLARSVFAQLRGSKPDGLAYGLFRDGNEFIHLFINMKDDDAAVLTEMPSFKAFSQNISERCEVQPTPQRLAAQLLESYGFRT